ncbi:MAG TPA: flavin reductase, partial [Ruminococcaceae bacterium]|nr:flavin reductase [Oscillospiraceae bacterium]
TYEFMEKYGDFTLSFFGGEYKKALSFCGAKSGRDYDKAKECNLSAVELGGSLAFEEANLIIACKKIAFADMDPSKFLVPEIEKNYHNGDYHRIYIGEITEVCQKV